MRPFSRNAISHDSGCDTVSKPVRRACATQASLSSAVKKSLITHILSWNTVVRSKSRFNSFRPFEAPGKIDGHRTRSFTFSCSREGSFSAAFALRDAFFRGIMGFPAYVFFPSLARLRKEKVFDSRVRYMLIMHILADFNVATRAGQIALHACNGPGVKGPSPHSPRTKIAPSPPRSIFNSHGHQTASSPPVCAFRCAPSARDT